MHRSPRFLILLAVFAMIAGLPSGAATAADSFTDDDGSVFEADIEWMAAEGITRGCNPPANDRFCPDSVVTRGQMATFLYRALGLPLPPANADPFVDDDDSMFENEIESLAAAGITKGCNPPANDRFCPDSRVTREQMAAFLVRAMGYTDNGGGNLFSDDDGSGFEGDIDRLGTAGVTLGCNPPANDRFCPKSPVTRGAMAAFLHRALEPKPADPAIGIELNKLPDWGKPPTHDLAVGDPSDWIDETVGETEYACQTQDMNLKTAPEEIVTFDLSSEFLWPGVLIQGGDFKVGSIKELPIRQRSPLPIFVNFSDGNIHRTITNPTPGTIAAAVGDVIGDADRSGYQPATKSVYTKTEGYNSEQMALHLGLSLKYMSSSLRTSLDMERDASQHTLTVYFKENAFTANVDGLPQNPSEFFSAAFTPQVLAEQERLGRISETNLPTYVSSVTYGRILMFSVTSSEDISTIKAAMDGVAKWGTGSVSAAAKAEYKRVVSGNTSDVVTVGGSSAAASAAIASGDFTEYFKESTALTEYTPISYVLRDLKGNIAYLGETTDYSVKTCHAVEGDPEASEVSLDGFEVTGDCEGTNTGPNGGEFFARFFMGNNDADPEADINVLQWGDPKIGIEGNTVPFDQMLDKNPMVIEPGNLNSDGQFPINGSIYERYMTTNNTFFHHVGDFTMSVDPEEGVATEGVRACSPTQGPNQGGNWSHDPWTLARLPLCTDPPTVRFGPETTPIVWQPTSDTAVWKSHRSVASHTDEAASCRVVLNYTIWAKP